MPRLNSSENRRDNRGDNLMISVWFFSETRRRMLVKFVVRIAVRIQ
jgi:hypothetical protein